WFDTAMHGLTRPQAVKYCHLSNVRLPSCNDFHNGWNHGLGELLRDMQSGGNWWTSSIYSADGSPFSWDGYGMGGCDFDNPDDSQFPPQNAVRCLSMN
ncbi:MAG: hypothetical protein ACXVCS_22435, partial [Bdellovibrionota bacterium]